MPHFQQFNVLRGSYLQTVGHFLFRGCEMRHLYFIIDHNFVTQVFFFQMGTINRKIKFKSESWYITTSTV